MLQIRCPRIRNPAPSSHPALPSPPVAEAVDVDPMRIAHTPTNSKRRKRGLDRKDAIPQAQRQRVDGTTPHPTLNGSNDCSSSAIYAQSGTQPGTAVICNDLHRRRPSRRRPRPVFRLPLIPCRRRDAQNRCHDTCTTASTAGQSSTRTGGQPSARAPHSGTAVVHRGSSGDIPDGRGRPGWMRVPTICEPEI